MRETAHIRHITNLVSSAEAGGYSLPAELLDVYGNYTRVRQIDVPEPTVLDPDTAATRLIASDVDVLELARTVAQGQAELETARRARELVGLAAERAGAEVVDVASDMVAAIITDHLRPALMDTYSEARKVAAALAGYNLKDVHRMVTAPPKVRTAYAALPTLAHRRSILLAAKRSLNTAGGHAPRRDASGLFAEFRHPMHFHPTLAPTSRIPAFTGPQDPTERLLWIVSDEAAPAKPWFPTADEQDAAWMSEFGAAIDERNTRVQAAQAFARS